MLQNHMQIAPGVIIKKAAVAWEDIMQEVVILMKVKKKATEP